MKTKMKDTAIFRTAFKTINIKSINSRYLKLLFLVLLTSTNFSTQNHIHAQAQIELAQKAITTANQLKTLCAGTGPVCAVVLAPVAAAAGKAAIIVAGVSGASYLGYKVVVFVQNTVNNNAIETYELSQEVWDELNGSSILATNFPTHFSNAATDSTTYNTLNNLVFLLQFNQYQAPIFTSYINNSSYKELNNFIETLSDELALGTTYDNAYEIAKTTGTLANQRNSSSAGTIYNEIINGANAELARCNDNDANQNNSSGTNETKDLVSCSDYALSLLSPNNKNNFCIIPETIVNLGLCFGRALAHTTEPIRSSLQGIFAYFPSSLNIFLSGKAFNQNTPPGSLPSNEQKALENTCPNPQTTLAKTILDNTRKLINQCLRGR